MKNVMCLSKGWVWAFVFSLGLMPLSALAVEKEIQLESVVMGTDGQMRARINGAYLTRQQVKEGVKVVDIDYQRVLVEYQGQIIKLTPGERWSSASQAP